MTASANAPHHQQINVTEDGHVVASSDVSTPTNPHGTARVTLHAESGHVPAGARAHLVDAVLDLPEVRLADHLLAYAPLGDTESIRRIGERTTDMRTHAAGCTAVVDADIKPACNCTDPQLLSRSLAAVEATRTPNHAAG